MGNRIGRAFLVVMVALGLFACKGGEVHQCKDTPTAVATGPLDPSGEVLDDRTGGGRLQGAAFTGATRPQRAVFLLDYSGSMFGGYESGRANCWEKPVAGKRPPPLTFHHYYGVPQFKDLLAQLMDAATAPGGPTQADIVLFNAKVWQVTPEGPKAFAEPMVLPGDIAAGEGPAPFRARIEAIKPRPYDVDAKAPDSTGTSEALGKVIDALPDEGVVWLLTDNYADQGSTKAQQEEAAGNRAFYDLLASDPRIQIVAFYPLHLRDQNSWMCGSSLVAYGLYVSKHERAPSEEVARLWGTDANGQGPLDAGLLWNPALKALYESFGGSSPQFPALSGTPMRLKPVDQNVVSVGFVPFAEKDGQERVLHCGRASFDDPMKCEAQIVLRNVLRHQRVDHARLDIANLTLTPFLADKLETKIPWASSVCPGDMKVSKWVIPETNQTGTSSTIELGAIAPLESRTVQVAFDVPPVTVGHDGLGQLWDIALTDAFELRGTLQANITDVVTALNLNVSTFKDVYGIENLPTSFRGSKTDRLRIEGPARARFTNDGQRLAMLMLLGLFMLVAGVLLGGFLMQPVYHTIRVDGREHARIKLRRMGRFRVEVRGRTIARAVRGFGGDARLLGGPGWRLKPDGPNGFIAARADGGDPDEHRVELLRGWTNPGNSGGGAGNRGL